MRKTLFRLAMWALGLMIYASSSLADYSLSINLYPTDVNISYGALNKKFSLKYYIVNNSDQASITDFQFGPSGSSTENPLANITYENDCGNIVPAQADAGVCTVTVTFEITGNQPGEASVFDQESFSFGLTYGQQGAENQGLESPPAVFSFATGQLTGLTRSITFNNQCSNPVWFGVSAGATDSIRPDPSVTPADPKSCTKDGDCYPGSKCVQIQEKPTVLSHCFWDNPAPSDNVYRLPAFQSGQTVPSNSIAIPVYDNGTSIIWSGGVAGRSNCVNGVCETADCGNAQENVTGACRSAQGFLEPVTAAEFTFENITPVVYSNTPNGNTANDTYDITVINGINGMNGKDNLGISMAPRNVLSGAPAKPYFCGTPGSPVAQSPLGASSWKFTPPSDDFYWVRYGTNAEPCTPDGSCTAAGEVCGNSFNPMAMPGAQINKTCGVQIGYWTADAICAKDPEHDADPFYCTEIVQEYFDPTVEDLTAADLFGCSRGDLGKSCYSAGADSFCCGCADWSEIAGINVPPAPVTDQCQNRNYHWEVRSLPLLEWLKESVPTAYTYPFDDASSTFTCQRLTTYNSEPVNDVDYIVTFCPALAAAGSVLPVFVVGEENDGTLPGGCLDSIDQNANGLPEVALDLDGDGTADICLGSAEAACDSSHANLDCAPHAHGGSLCSVEDGLELMDGNATAAANIGDMVGPGFSASPDSIFEPLATPLVVGFRGSSSNPGLHGYFELQINDVDGEVCRYSFGNVYFADESETRYYGDIAPITTRIPTLNHWAMILLGLLLVSVAFLGMRRGD